MSHSYNRLWIHAIWSTKDRHSLITPAIENILYDQLKNQFIESGCSISIINGAADHVHCLFLLNHKKALADIIKQVKGASSHWINQQDIITEKFAWQTGYAAYSVSESVFDKVYQYILNQKKHHTKKTFVKEYEEFIAVHGLSNETT
ncbi:MAG: IS200/IS605 family transposase [Chitinophagaceae bacterium]|nr:IS200/IS605 family transposase [Chitinophagaceae bacterium]MBP9102386.1 IS200/IS605 family transposase [Chitinophagaceae bacterium]